MEGTILHYISAAWRHLTSIAIETTSFHMGWRHLCQECHGDIYNFLYPEERQVHFGGRQDGTSCYICCVHSSSSLQPLGNQQHGGNLSISVPNSLTFRKMDPSSWFLIVLQRLFMTRFLYLLSLLKKEKKRKKGAGCLFNFEQMEKIMYWWFFVPERNQDCVLIFFPLNLLF